MKRHVNLLPPQEQQQLRLFLLNKEVLSFGAWVFLSLLILLLVLFVSNLFLRQERAALIEQIQFDNRSLQEVREAGLHRGVEELNQNLANYRQLADQSKAWSAPLTELARLLPADVTLDALQAGAEDGKLELKGRAGTRFSVLQLRNNLLDSQSFAKVDFPLANLEKAVDTSWSYRLFIKSFGAP